MQYVAPNHQSRPLSSTKDYQERERERGKKGKERERERGADKGNEKHDSVNRD
jgi:hypothetical protein